MNVRTIFLVLLVSSLSLVTNASTKKPQQSSTIGVMILAHGSMGSDQTWNTLVKEVSSPLKEKYVVEVAFGMANAPNMQHAIDKLEAQGVSKIVVVQLFVSSYSPIIRQNEYLLGLRDELADAPMPMMLHDHATGRMTVEIPKDLQPLTINAEILLTPPLDDHALVAEIVLDRIEKLSINPSKETVLIVAHGPNSPEDNELWLTKIRSISQQIEAIQAEKGITFGNIIAHTVRDDADAETHEQARLKFRKYVEDANAEGTAIVIPLLLSQGGVEEKYLTRLEGLNFKWSGETLLPHLNISRFIQQSVENALITASKP